MSAHTYYWETTQHAMTDETGRRVGHIQKLGSQWAAFTTRNGQSVPQGLFTSAFAAKVHIKTADAKAEAHAQH